MPSVTNVICSYHHLLIIHAIIWSRHHLKKKILHLMKSLIKVLSSDIFAPARACMQVAIIIVVPAANVIGYLVEFRHESEGIVEGLPVDYLGQRHRRHFLDTVSVCHDHQHVRIHIEMACPRAGVAEEPLCRLLLFCSIEGIAPKTADVGPAMLRGTSGSPPP